MNLISCFVAFLAGAIIGIIFFGNLRWTVARMGSTNHPVAIYGASLLLRMLMVFVMAFIAVQISIMVLVIGLCGFTIARFAIVTTSAFAGSTTDASESWPQ